MKLAEFQSGLGPHVVSYSCNNADMSCAVMPICQCWSEKPCRIRAATKAVDQGDRIVALSGILKSYVSTCSATLRAGCIPQMFGLPHFASNYCFLSFSTAVSAWALATKLAGSLLSQSVLAHFDSTRCL